MLGGIRHATAAIGHVRKFGAEIASQQSSHCPVELAFDMSGPRRPQARVGPLDGRVRRHCALNVYFFGEEATSPASRPRRDR